MRVAQQETTYQASVGNYCFEFSFPLYLYIYYMSNNVLLSLPLTVSVKAVGNYCFEFSFPFLFAIVLNYSHLHETSLRISGDMMIIVVLSLFTQNTHW